MRTILLIILSLFIWDSSEARIPNDSFNDNSTDTGTWTAVVIGGATVTETNGELQCFGDANGDISGYVTTNTHDLTALDMTVDVNNDTTVAQQIWVCLTKVTATNPWDEDDWYRIAKDNKNDEYVVYNQVAGGGQTELASGAWTGASGSLRITISGGTITFYEEGNNRHSEAYALGSYTAYIYILVEMSLALAGTDELDNFIADDGSQHLISAF